MERIQQLSHLWHKVGMRMKDEMYGGKHAAILGVSMVELSILEVIERYPSCMMKKVSDILGLPKSTLTNAIKRLEEKKYIERSPCTTDKRAYSLKLTGWGQQTQGEHRSCEMSVFQELLQQLSAQEVDMFLKLFAKAVNASEKGAVHE